MYDQILSDERVVEIDQPEAFPDIRALGQVLLAQKQMNRRPTELAQPWNAFENG